MCFRDVAARGALLLAALLLAAPPAQAQGSEPPAPDPFAAFEAAGASPAPGGDPFAQALGAAPDAPPAAAPGGAFGGSGGLELLGFAEVEHGVHVGPRGAQERDVVLDNLRVRLQTSRTTPGAGAYLKLDFFQDGVTGASGVELREARLAATPLTWLDLSVGRQVNTWGLGDMVFINDLFPKDWVAMFTGRDMEDLKVSANSLRLTAYGGPLTWDVVVHPRFAPDAVPSGCRFSVYDPNTQALVANPDACGEAPTRAPEGSGRLQDGEAATRLMTRLGPLQAALYGYTGFWKSPRGVMWVETATGTPVTDRAPNPATDRLEAFHPRLNVFGLSLEGQVGPGILALEAGHYDSLDDPDGTDFLIENSTWKTLMGYRMDFTAAFGAGVQWYTETMDDYAAYEEAVRLNAPQSFDRRKARRRDTYTLRLTVKAQQETLWVNLFGYERPQDRDGYYKLDVTKRFDDHLAFTAGANVFKGREGYLDREFGMLRDDDNVFGRLRYNF